MGKKKYASSLRGDKSPEINLLIGIYEQALKDYISAYRSIERRKEKGCEEADWSGPAAQRLNTARAFILEDPYGVLEKPAELVRCLEEKAKQSCRKKRWGKKQFETDTVYGD